MHTYMHNVLKINFGKKKETKKSPLKLLIPFSFVTSTFQTHLQSSSLLPKVPMRKSEHSILTLLPKNNGYYRNVIPEHLLGCFKVEKCSSIKSICNFTNNNLVNLLLNHFLSWPNGTQNQKPRFCWAPTKSKTWRWHQEIPHAKHLRLLLLLEESVSYTWVQKVLVLLY